MTGLHAASAASATSPEQRWDAALDDLEDWLSVLEVQVARGLAAVDEPTPRSAFVPPSDLPAMPPVMVRRAIELLDKQKELSARLEQLRKDVVHQLSAARLVPTFHDTRNDVHIDFVA